MFFIKGQRYINWYKKTAANRGLFFSGRDYFLASAAGAAGASAGAAGAAGAFFLASSM
jgi:hypothetical protein